MGGHSGIIAKVGNDKLIAAIRAKRGNLASLARDLDVSRQGMWAYVQKHPTLKAVFEEQLEIKLDDAESALDKNCVTGDTSATKYFLDTQGRKRGYGQVVKVVTEKEASPADALMDKFEAMNERSATNGHGLPVPSGEDC